MTETNIPQHTIIVPASIPMVALLGPGDEHLALIEKAFKADVHVRGNQITLRVTDSSTFITNTSPASLMKIVNFYTSYIVLRMIVSVDDSRVKFMGRDRLDNLSQALNRYLSEPCGVSAVRATMPDAENPILDDLEDAYRLVVGGDGR